VKVALVERVVPRLQIKAGPTQEAGVSFEERARHEEHEREMTTERDIEAAFYCR